MKPLQTEGTFNARILPPEPSYILASAKKGTPHFALTLVVTDGPCEGQTASWQGWLSEKAMDSSVRALSQATGLEVDLAALAAAEDESIFPTADVSIEVEDDPWENEKGEWISSYRVKWLNRRGGGRAGAKLEGDAMKALIAGLGRKVKGISKDALQGVPAVKKAAAPANATAPADPEPEDDDDDVPF